MDDRALTRALGAVIADIRCHPELLMQIAEHLSTHGWRLLKAAEERFESGRR